MATATRLGIYSIDNQFGHFTTEFIREAFSDCTRIVAKVYVNGKRPQAIYGDGIFFQRPITYTRQYRYGTAEVREYEDIQFLDMNDQQQNTILANLFANRHALDFEVDNDNFGRSIVLWLNIR